MIDTNEDGTFIGSHFFRFLEVDKRFIYSFLIEIFEILHLLINITLTLKVDDDSSAFDDFTSLEAVNLRFRGIVQFFNDRKLGKVFFFLSQKLLRSCLLSFWR